MTQTNVREHMIRRILGESTREVLTPNPAPGTPPWGPLHAEPPAQAALARPKPSRPAIPSSHSASRRRKCPRMLRPPESSALSGNRSIPGHVRRLPRRSSDPGGMDGREFAGSAGGARARRGFYALGEARVERSDTEQRAPTTLGSPRRGVGAPSSRAEAVCRSSRRGVGAPRRRVSRAESRSTYGR